MSTQRGQKLNQLQHILPEGLVVDAGWLEARHYSTALRRRYLANGWLERPARCVYRRPGGKLLWQHVVISLQSLLGARVFVGGRTALEMHGFAHYISKEGSREVHLYGDKSLPGWVKKLDLGVQFVFHNAGKLFPEEPISAGPDVVSPSHTVTSNVGIHGSLTHQHWGQWNWPIKLSTPERAILELLDEVPERESFHEADHLMEGLRTLSPRRLQNLLEDCHNVKVKRLFFWFAERHYFQWLLHIQEERIDLGKGKRMLVRGGKLDPKYLITVPEDLHAGR